MTCEATVSGTSAPGAPKSDSSISGAQTGDREAGLLSRWVRFVRERCAVPVLITFGVAQAASAQYLVRARLDVEAMVLAAVGITALLGLLRLMDELKDLEKDKLAHPERPLPRGLLSVDEAHHGLWWGTGTLLAGSLLIAAVTNPLAGVLYGITVVYAHLMYREFFAPRFLEARPFTYAVTHQGILFPLYAFATAVAAPEYALSAPVLWFGLTGLGASFAYEVCRKLDPEAHPALRTYLTVYGRHRTVAAVTVALTLLCVAALEIGAHVFVGPLAVLLLALLSLIYLRPERFRLVEGVATLLLLVQVLAPTLRHFWGGLQ